MRTINLVGVQKCLNCLHCLTDKQGQQCCHLSTRPSDLCLGQPFCNVTGKIRFSNVRKWSRSPADGDHHSHRVTKGIQRGFSRETSLKGTQYTRLFASENFRVELCVLAERVPAVYRLFGIRNSDCCSTAEREKKCDILKAKE